jgi:hypothetical protein
LSKPGNSFAPAPAVDRTVHPQTLIVAQMF